MNDVIPEGEATRLFTVPITEEFSREAAAILARFRDLARREVAEIDALGEPLRTERQILHGTLLETAKPPKMPLPDLERTTAGLSRTWSGVLRDGDRSPRSGNYPETSLHNYLQRPQSRRGSGGTRRTRTGHGPTTAAGNCTCRR